MTYLKGVSTLEYDISLCTGCSMCKAVCPHPVFQIINKKAEILDKDLCMGMRCLHDELPCCRSDCSKRCRLRHCYHQFQTEGTK